MKSLLIATIVLTSAFPAAAQQEQKSKPVFVPFTVDKQAYDELTAWLLDQPTKFGAPVINWLNAQEQKQKDGKKSDAGKKAP